MRFVTQYNIHAKKKVYKTMFGMYSQTSEVGLDNKVHEIHEMK